jgi:hypothetical protein
MKKIYKNYTILIVIIACFGNLSCNKDKKTNDSTSKQSLSKQSELKQLNISILLDLSDRIDTVEFQCIPQHYERDIEIVKSFADFFVKDMTKRGTFNSKGKIQVIFSPTPNDPNVNIFAQKLNVDCSAISNIQKKEIYDNLNRSFTENITKIYRQTLKDNKWPGCDIWSFFKNDVDMYIDKNKDYRNILVIVTDGYIYHQDTKVQTNNRFSYILPELLTKYKLRNNVKWEEQLKKNDFGLISKRNDLANLEVLVLEVSPSSKKFKSDEDILKGILSKWFSEMGVKRQGIYFSDLPVYTKKRITDFIYN